mgnify:CR=1 FL=1
MTGRRAAWIGLMGLAGAVMWLGLGGVFDLEAILRHRATLVDLVDRHFAAAAVLFLLAYIVVVGFALPMTLVMTLLGGWLFGALWGSVLTAVAATTGAIALFVLARGLLHDHFVRSSGPLMNRLRAGFHAEAASYLLILRLAPVFPFFVVNLASALLGARLSTYIWTTFFGILPGTVAYTLAGAGFGAVLEQEAARLTACAAAGTGPCLARLEAGALVSRQVLVALAALAGVTALSILARRWLRRGAAERKEQE